MRNITHNIIKRIVKISLCVLLATSLISTGYNTLGKSDTNTVQASSSRKCYLIGTSNVRTYSNTSLTNAIGWIYPSDEISVITVTDVYCYVGYPVSGNRIKYAYIPTKSILLSTTGKTYRNNVGNFTTYIRPGGAKYGVSTKNDSITILGSYGYYYQIKYNVSGGFKYAFAKKSDVERAIGVTSTNTSSNVATTKLSYALYKNTSAYISCGFDGYRTVGGRHEGIDFVCGNGKAIYSLTNGVVVRVAYGYRGSSGLSTIAIYDSSCNKTVIYLHSAPTSLRAGQTICKGQYLGTQDWRGVSSASGGHTHVEVCNGRVGYAKKSVGDYTLENPNPTSYWNSKGYIIG